MRRFDDLVDDAAQMLMDAAAAHPGALTTNTCHVLPYLIMASYGVRIVHGALGTALRFQVAAAVQWLLSCPPEWPCPCSLVTDERLLPNPAGVPLFLFGESMGGAIAISLAQRLSIGGVPAAVSSRVKGVILSGPVVRISPRVLVRRADLGPPGGTPS
jgi:pimeloyl-ACP methyl ester carboxylesterase